MSKKALLVGCNYVAPDGSMDFYGSVNDAFNIANLLVGSFGYQRKNIRLLLDHNAKFERPNEANVKKWCNWLIKDAKPGDNLVFGYFGHGGQTYDIENGDEKDKLDEVMCLVDDGFVTDDYFHEMVISKLPEGVTLTCIIDCCVSGTICDLPHVEMFQGYVKPMPATTTYELHEGALAKMPKATVMCISSCMDSESSYEYGVYNAQDYFPYPLAYPLYVCSEGTTYSGFMSREIAKVVTKNPQLNWRQLLRQLHMVSNVKAQLQVPVISTTKRELFKNPFTM